MLAALLGTLVGIVLGLTGAGGSIFAVPLLMFGLGWSLPQASPVALLAVCAAAAFGTASIWRSGLIAPRAALITGIAGSLSSPLGIALAARLPRDALVGTFAVVMSIVALRMLRQSRVDPEATAAVRGDPAGFTGRDGAICRIDISTSQLRWTRACAAVLAAAGGMTGILSGALGVGAGFVIVPTLRSVTQLSMQASVATSLMTITLISAAAVAAHLITQGSSALPLAVAAPFVAGAIAGMFASRRLAPRLPGPLLQRLFAALMLGAAALLVWRQWSGPGA